MFRKINLVVFLAVVLGIAGCKLNTGPLPVGAVDSIDANANEILQPAHAFAASLTAAVQSTDPSVHIELTPGQKGILVNLNVSLNDADALEIAYHNAPNPANANALQTASAVVAKNFAAAQSSITVTNGLWLSNTK